MKVLMKTLVLPMQILIVGCFCYTTDCGFEFYYPLGSDESHESSSSSSDDDDSSGNEVTVTDKQPVAAPSSSTNGK